MPPRVSLTDAYDVTTIPSPATGLLVYCKGDAGLAAGYYFFNGTAWATIANAGGSGSVAAEFGTQILGSTVAVNSATPVDVLSFTLPSPGTWEIIYFLRAQGAAGFAAEFGLYDPSGTIVPNSEILAAFGEQASTGTGVIRVTTTGSVTYKLKAWASNGTYGVYSELNGRTGVTWKKISGNAPVTGQSVDYVQASLSANQSLSAVANINFNVSSGAGITITSGGFNLIANKTYKLEAALGGTSGGYAYYGWVDNTNTLLSGGSIGAVMKAGSAFTDAPQDKAVVYFTPSVNTTVYLRVYNLSGTLTAYAPSTSSNYSSTWANIQQVGSSAIINPWTLSGTNTYNTTGNLGIGTNAPTSKLNIAGGGVRIASGLGNSSTRPSVNTGTIGNYEIRGVGGGASQVDGQDDGFLRLSAGGGTNAIQQSSIDLSGYSATVPDMNSNIVMRTSGAERLRIDASGNVNVTGKINLTDPTGNVSTKAAAFVDAGTFVTLDNLKTTVTTSGARGLSLSTVTGTLNLYVQGVYTNQSGAAYTSYTNTPVAYTTTASGSMFGWNFEQAGNTIIYHLTDATNSRLYRVTLIIMPSFLKNFISIERLL